MLSTIFFLFLSSTAVLIGFYVLTVVVEHVNNVRADRAYRTADNIRARSLYRSLV